MQEPISASAITLLTPLPGRVILQRTEPASAPSAYVIPDASKDKPVEAIVIAIPRLPYYEYGVLLPCPFDKGERVLVGKYAGDHKFRNEDVTIVRWDEVLAVIAEDGNKPSAADLDHVADEQRVKELTSRFLNKLAEEGGQIAPSPDGSDLLKKPLQSDYRAVPRI